MKVTLRLRGLCRFAMGADRCNVFLLEGHGHSATMTARLRALDLANTATPDSIGLDADGEQVGLWSLASRSLEFSESGGAAPRWDDRHLSLDLGARHKNGAVTPTSAPGVVLRGGRLSCHGSRDFRVSGKKPETGPFATEIQWAGSNVSVTGLRLAFKRPPIIIGVLNIAPVLEGLGHFAHYYDDSDVPESDRITIAYAEDAPAVDFDEPVYDCVPPIPFP